MADEQTERDIAVPAAVVVGRQFSAWHAVNFTVTGAGGLFSLNDCYDDRYKVIDINGDVVFKVKGFFLSRRCILVDAAGNPLLTFEPKVISFHETWRVFRGDSTSPNDLLFIVRKHEIFQWNDNFDVFLATNTTDRADHCDFKIISRCQECTICMGESDQIIAQMHRKTAFFARDKLEVTVNPNVDYVFILSLIIVLELIRENRRRHRRY